MLLNGYVKIEYKMYYKFLAINKAAAILTKVVMSLLLFRLIQASVIDTIHIID
jgi:hypothetical protein